MNRKSLFGAGLALAALAGAAMLAIDRPVEPIQATAPTTPSVAPAALSAAATEPAHAVAATPALSFARVRVNTSGAQPEACLAFSAPLLENTRYEDYIAIRPAFRPGLSVRGAELCLTGLAYGREYQLDLLAGLPGIDGAVLRETESVPLSLGDRPASVALGGGTILPRESSQGVPITTVNVSEVDVEVYRVGERGWPLVRQDYLQPQRQTWRWNTQDMAERRGARIWSGTLAVKNEPNQQVVTAFPLADTIKPRKPGLYWIVAGNGADRGKDGDGWSYRDQRAAQWVIDTDIALTTYRSSEGLTVLARSFQSAKPKPNVALALIARNNDELARTTTDAEGRAHFAAGLLRGAGGAAAATVMAFDADEDFNLLDLGRPAFDLSDRGVGGRASPGAADAFLWTERGIYRPGETVQLMALLRDRVANAMTDTPAQIVVLRPDGVEFQRFSARSGMNGAINQPVALSPSAPRGLWSAALHIDPTGPAVGRVSFDVQDFVPQRLKVTLTTEKTEFARGDVLELGVEARFLYGAPAAELQGEGEALVESDPTPWPAYAAYRFGLAEERVQPTTIPLAVETTDSQGRTVAKGTVNALPDTTRPLRMTARIAVFEPGGRSTEDSVVLKVRPATHAIGIRPLFRDNRTPWSSTANFEAIVVDREGMQVAMNGMSYDLIREDFFWNWFNTGEGWRYEPSHRDRFISGGRFDAAPDKPAVIREKVNWGPYRLVVRAPDGGIASSVRFYAGWGNESGVDATPDRLDVTAGKPLHHVGETVTIRIASPYSGEATVAIANDRVIETRSISVPAGGATVEIPVAESWGAGAYALVTLVRPLTDETNRHAPVRAIGVAWLGVDTTARRLAVDIEAAGVVRPRQAVDVVLRVRDGSRNAQVTLAAVDEGILQLTRFQTPSPQDFYFGKRRLGVELRDDYGRLIDGRQGVLGAIRQGGDSAVGGKGLEVVPTRTVALFSGPLAVDSEGRVRVRLDIPDFTGELRLMAVAYDESRVGNGEGRMKVRDPLVSDATLPRFLAPGDTSRLSLWLHNVEAPAGDYRVAWRAEGPLALDDAQDRVLTLGGGAKQLLTWTLKARDVGIGRVVLRLTGPNGFDVLRDWSLQVRPAQAATTVTRTARLAAGETIDIDRGLVDAFVPGTESVGVSVASWRGFDVPGLIQALDRYPFGCLEQTTSRAFPLLYFNEVALLGRLAGDKSVEARVQDAIWRVLDMQQDDGGFGMWSSSSTIADAWISVFAVDFLAQAKSKGKIVPDRALQQAFGHLRLLAERSTPRTRAYALYVLAREGQADVGRLRYFHDSEAVRLPSALSLGQLGAALILVGERGRAENAFALARPLIGQSPREDYYGSSLRDAAALIAAAASAKQDALMQTAFDFAQGSDRAEAITRTTTQERAWMLLATQALSRSGGKLRLTRDGRIIETDRGRAVISLDRAEIARGVAIGNEGDRDAWATISVSGVPTAPLPPASKGVTIARRFLTLDGQRADLAALRQNDRLVVSIEGTRQDPTRDSELIVLDLLPAGFEIEGLVQRDANGRSRFAFLPAITGTAMREARDDRFVAALEKQNAWWQDRDFHLAYVVRAITPGTYTLPAVTVEDMYRPDVQARSNAGLVTITARE